MPYPVQKYIRTLNQFCVATNAFTPEEVDKIIDLEDLQKFQNGAVGGGGKGQVNHIDSGNTYQKYERKISASIILTDPSKYEGGEFECVLNGRVDEPFIGKPNKGDVIFFSSWMPHRVRPVTSGIRKSLVCWVMGARTW